MSLVAFIFAQKTLEIPYPTDAVNVIDSKMYSYYRYELMSDCAYEVHAYALGLWATHEALKAQPHNKRLQENLKKYQKIIH